MEASSQKGRRVPRPWTTRDQIFAEVSAACGVPFEVAARAIGRRGSQLRYHLVPEARITQRRCAKQWEDSNKERLRELGRIKMRIWRRQNPELDRERRLKYQAANKEKIRARGAEYARKHRERINAAKRKRYAECPEYRERQKESARRWHEQNREASNRASKAWAERNREKLAEYRRRYYQINRERILEQTRRYHLRNPDIGRGSSRRWSSANPEKRKAICASYRERNRHKTREASRRCQSARRAQKRRSLVAPTMPALMIRYAIFAVKCCYCGTGGKLEVDHVLPLSLGGLDDVSNIVPACRRCNASKNANPVESWYRRQPFFTDARWRKIQRHCPAVVTGQLPLALPV